MMILDIVLGYFGMKYDEDLVIESVHNYIAEDGIIRKGAIRAYQGEKVVIPLNMAKGIVLGVGKGNKLYNFSAPHGAGRVHGRKDMHRRLEAGKVTMEDYRKSMDGVFSTSVKKATIDESPFAYKAWEDIEDDVKETITVWDIARPIYNLKDDSEGPAFKKKKGKK
jgi:tRNA-splicing ligase RtcB